MIIPVSQTPQEYLRGILISDCLELAARLNDGQRQKLSQIVQGNIHDMGLEKLELARDLCLRALKPAVTP